MGTSARARRPRRRTSRSAPATAGSACCPSSTSAVSRSSPARRLPGARVRIGAGEEILVRGPMVSHSALGDDGWLHTGDRGRIDDEGFLHVEGRLKDTIVTGGENVAAAEV